METKRLDLGSAQRMVSIEILRALAILLMVQIHFTYELSYMEPSSWIVYALSMGLGELPAPIFSFVVGLSLHLWIEKKKGAGWNEGEIIKAIVRRGLFLFLTGLGFLVFSWGPAKIFTWDILTFLGTSTIVLLLFRQWSVRRIIVLTFAVILVSPVLRTVAHYASSWTGDEYNWHIYTVGHVVLGWFLRGYFPLLPWIVFPLMGFAVGKQLSSRSVKAGRPILLTGLVFSCLAGGSVFLGSIVHNHLEGYFGDLTEYPASTSFILTMVGMSCLGFWILNHRLDNKKEAVKGRSVISFFKRYGSFSLTIYIVHHMAFIWPVRVVAMCRGTNFNDYWQQVLSPPEAVLLAVLFIVIFDQILKKWEKKRRYSIEGLLRWLM